MNNINFESKVVMQAIQLIVSLREIQVLVDQLDDKVLHQKIKSENPFNLLDLNNYTQTQQNSNYDLFDTSNQVEVSEKMDEEDQKKRVKNKDKQQKRIQTKRKNYILKNKDDPYECGYCQSLFKSPCSLGGHIQKHHKTKTTIYSLVASLYSAQSEQN